MGTQRRAGPELTGREEDRGGSVDEQQFWEKQRKKGPRPPRKRAEPEPAWLGMEAAAGRLASGGGDEG